MKALESPPPQKCNADSTCGTIQVLTSRDGVTHNPGHTTPFFTECRAATLYLLSPCIPPRTADSRIALHLWRTIFAPYYNQHVRQPSCSSHVQILRYVLGGID